jgi:thiopeptide-type bacteriocin biosynthesis protein
VFQPGGRVGNIAQRLSFFEYEIPYLAGAGVETGKQLPVHDLLLSVRNNEVVLRSSRINKRVIPRLSNAHNFTTSTLPVYQFLSFLQYPDEVKPGIDWGHPTLKRRFLPRVTYGNLILHRARWFLYSRDISLITGSAGPIVLLRDFISKWKVARFVTLSEGDNELFIDTANGEYLELLLTEMKKRHFIKLVEWPFGLPVPDQVSGGYEIQQFILPLTGNYGKKYLPFSITAHHNRIRGIFEPGSEWIYFKIYCSAGFSDKILMEVVKPSVDLLVKENVISKAFFIRYTDPHYHIRFRLQLRDDVDRRHTARVLEYVYMRIQPFSETGVVWNVELDTYRREVGRYGEEFMMDSEAVFFHDSRLLLHCLAHEVFSGNDETRFLAAIKNLDKWLSLFGMATKEKMRFCESMVEIFSKEFGPDVKFRADLSYRELSGHLFIFFDSFMFDREFEEREANLLKLSLSQKNLGSYIHMSMNRWFVTEQRLMEYMCYTFAGKYYKQILHYQPKNN